MVELTNLERSCLQLWFRQAIAKLEQEEAVSEILRRQAQEAPTGSRHRNQSNRRPRRRIIDTLRSQRLSRA
ncbi:MAG: hypothetical protein HY711_11390 [Candidatus Melainabacteria bacterium]|nr:hypothetical protein [Candidatus Melainabacteria bacterium]